MPHDVADHTLKTQNIYNSVNFTDTQLVIAECCPQTINQALHRGYLRKMIRGPP